MGRRKVVISGGFGFVGQELCKALLRDGKLAGDEVSEIVLFDMVAPEPRPAFCSDGRVREVLGDICDPEVCRGVVQAEGTELSVFHLGGIMSGQGEQDFDLCLRVNMDASRNLLEAARAVTASSGSQVRFLFASSGACFGETMDCPVGDTTKIVPLNTYGMTKACCELFVNDYTRKGFVNGRSVRLPTVIVRAGKPNAATTSCYSGVIREPLHGVDVALPVERNLKHAVTSIRTIVQNLVSIHDVSWPEGIVDRAVTLTSFPVTLGMLVDSLFRVVAEEDHGKLGKITDAIDPFLNRVVSGMAVKEMAHQRAKSFGCVEPPDLDTIVREFLEDFGSEAVVKAKAFSPPARAPAPSGDASKVAVVTGGGTGVGRAVAAKLAEKAGFTHVVLVGRRRDPLDETKKALADAGLAAEVHCLTCDITKAAAVARTFAEIEARFGRCDLLFNNAGCGAPKVSPDELPVEAWQTCIDTNLTGAYLCAREAFGLMRRQAPQGGRIINNGSISADRPRPNSCAYTASKHAITGLTKSLALDGRPFDIACGQIDIGNALTEMSKSLSEPPGALQPSGESMVEPMIDVRHVGDAVAYMAGLPLEANTLSMTVMATKMPLVGRG